MHWIGLNSLVSVLICSVSICIVLYCITTIQNRAHRWCVSSCWSPSLVCSLRNWCFHVCYCLSSSSFLSLSLCPRSSLSLTHIHTHTHSLPLPLPLTPFHCFRHSLTPPHSFPPLPPSSLLHTHTSSLLLLPLSYRTRKGLNGPRAAPPSPAPLSAACRP